MSRPQNLPWVSLWRMAPTPLEPGLLIYAHRGDRTRAPDNTLDAYRLAVESGADGVELDVRRSKDGVLILHHDDRTPAIGVFALTESDEIRRVDPSVPTLREALDVIPSNVYVNVEIKNWPNEPGFDDERIIVDETIAEIRACDDPSRVLLSSFDPLAMARAGNAGREFLRGQLVTASVPFDVGLGFAQKFCMDAIHPELAHMRDAPVAIMQTIKDTGLHAVVWGVNTPQDVALMAEVGAAAIITDDPGMARGVINQA